MITEGQVLDIAKDAIYYIIICSAPVLIISLVGGLIISIFQTVTSIQEQTLTFVPKIVAVFIGLMVCGSWILNQLSEFVTTLWSNFSIFTSVIIIPMTGTTVLVRIVITFSVMPISCKP